MTGKFPTKMKTTKVIPLCKSGDKHFFKLQANLIVTTVFKNSGKGRLFTKRLNNFTYKHCILCEQQYGFRKNLTTSLAVMDFVEQITNATERKQYTVGVFYHLQKAFETIDHKLLLIKVQNMASEDWHMIG